MSDDPALLVFNIERVDASTLRGQGPHDNRESGDLSHIRHDRTHANKVLLGSGRPLRDCEAVIDKHKARTRADNKAPFDRIILSASRRHFKDNKTLNKWVQDSVKWLRKEYGPGLAYVAVHLDEKTPHLHAVAVPLVDRGEKGFIVSHSQHPSHKGKNSYVKMRKRAAGATGLDYGTPGGKPRTQALREAQEALEEARCIRQEAEATRRAAEELHRRALAFQARNEAVALRLVREGRLMGQAKASKRIEDDIKEAYPEKARRGYSR